MCDRRKGVSSHEPLIINLLICGAEGIACPLWGPAPLEFGFAFPRSGAALVGPLEALLADFEHATAAESIRALRAADLRLARGCLTGRRPTDIELPHGRLALEVGLLWEYRAFFLECRRDQGRLHIFRFDAPQSCLGRLRLLRPSAQLLLLPIGRRAPRRPGHPRQHKLVLQRWHRSCCRAAGEFDGMLERQGAGRQRQDVLHEGIVHGVRVHED